MMKGYYRLKLSLFLFKENGSIHIFLFYSQYAALEFFSIQILLTK